MLIYLAHPIDSRANKLKTELDRQIEYVRHSMKAKDHHLYHPGAAFVIGRTKVDHTVEAINRKAQETADGVMVLLPRDFKSWGVPAEIERARHLHQPVAIISDADPTWAMPNSELDPLVAWFRPDPGNYAKAIKHLEQNRRYATNVGNDAKWKQLREHGKKPSRAYLDDAGFDLYVSETVTIEPGTFMDIHTDVAMELPSNCWGLLTGRSSTTRNRGLLVNQGIIDTGYRGELYVGVWNLTAEPVTVYRGDRIAQLIAMPNRTAELTLVEAKQLTDHPRGENGFGSSGN